jgi:hypothetical protein
MFSCHKQYLTRLLRSLVRYCFCHLNTKSISPRNRLISPIYWILMIYRYMDWNGCCGCLAFNRRGYFNSSFPPKRWKCMPRDPRFQNMSGETCLRNRLSCLTCPFPTQLQTSFGHLYANWNFTRKYMHAEILSFWQNHCIFRTWSI